MPLDHLMTRRASFTPDTFNADAMTVEAVISTFAPVTRRDARGAYTERLDPAGLDLSGLIGSPVLDGHRQGSARDVIGMIAAYRMEGESLVATIRLSGAADAASIITRIQEGTLKGVSIGYRVTRWADSLDPVTKARLRTAAAWAISEVSAVPIPADAGATFRSQTMPEDLIENPAAPTPAENRAAIRTIARSAGMSTEQADDMVDRDLTTMEARSEAFEAMQTRARQTPRIRVIGSQEDPATVSPAVRLTPLSPAWLGARRQTMCGPSWACLCWTWPAMP
jgi:HK97 family phage prohead protease